LYVSGRKEVDTMDFILKLFGAVVVALIGIYVIIQIVKILFFGG
jgi:hypothetical protein